MMKHFLIALLLVTPAWAQRGGATNKLAVYIPDCAAITGACPADNYVCVSSTTIYRCELPSTWTAVSSPEIEDIYLLNSGDVGTGAYDFGGASDFEIPNGAAPTVNTAGEAAIDTTDDQFIYYGGAKRVLPYTKEKCVSLETPTDSDDNVPFFFPRDAITITDVYCEVDGGTSVALTISDGTNALEAITCDADGAEDDGTIANGTFSSLERMEFDLASTSGSNTWLAFCITYTVDAQ